MKWANLHYLDGDKGANRWKRQGKKKNERKGKQSAMNMKKRENDNEYV